MTGVREYEESQFSGALLWLQRWEIWSESIDQAGFVLLNGVRTISNCASSVHDAPAQQFAEGEFTLAHACLVLPMLFQWDAYYLTANGDVICYVCHEGYLELSVRGTQLHTESLNRFREWNAAIAPTN